MLSLPSASARAFFGCVSLAAALAACSRSTTPEQRDAAVTLGIPAPPLAAAPVMDAGGTHAAPQPAEALTVAVQTAHGNVKLPAIDRDPVASPAGDRVAYARGDALYLRNEFGDEEQLLVRGAPSSTPEANLTTLHSPRFSPAGDRVYFLSAAWGNTEAVHAVDVASKSVRFLVDGKRLDVVQKGPLRGDLVVVRQRISTAGGAPYDEAWLIGPDGAQVRAIGRMDAAGAERIVAAAIDGGALPDRNAGDF